ncbi:MAG: GNAT family N-acetyltransferase [Thermoguttaceae bacterium]
MSLTIRPMTSADISLGMRLKTQAGWNQTPADWQRFLDLEPRGCFVAEWNGQGVATTTTCTFDQIGWIAMVLVEETFRHRGIASGLVERALGYLDERGVRTVRLDATRLGRPIYERSGFIAEREFARMHGTTAVPCEMPGVAVADPGDLDRVAKLDLRATGTDRRRLLERLLAEHRDAAGVVRGDAGVEGYVMLRPGAVAMQVGPAASATVETGRRLADWAIGRCPGRPVFVDIPVDNPEATRWAHERGWTEQRRFWRMSRGRPIAEQPALLWGSSGPEKG